LLGFVTNSEDNVVYVFNKHTMEIVSAIATTSGPKGAVIDKRRDWVYIALAGDDAIEAIEVNTGEVLSRVQLNLGDEPTELALSGDGRILVSANYGSNTASIIDADSLREIGRVTLPAEPTSVVAGGSSGRAYALQPLSNAISILDSARGEIATTRIFDESPVRGALSLDENSLYVITRYSPNLLIIDAATLVLMERVYVGPGAVSIVVDRATGLIYVGKKTGNVSVVDPSSLLPIDRFRIPGNVAYLAIDGDENSLFAVLTDRALVQKMDLVSKKVRGVVEVGDGSFAVVTMGAR
jgi:DNA-binding beta-propeller fold protein YncE